MNEVQNNKVLVTGGTGFIGSHIVKELLLRGYPVRVFARHSSDRKLIKDLDIEIVEGDINSPSSLIQALKGCDYFVHCAAWYPIYSLSKKKAKYTALQQVSYIKEALKRSNLKRFIYISSPTAVGKYQDGSPEDENAPYPVERNKSVYCLVKHIMHETFLKSASEYNSIIIAPTAVYGAGDIKPTTGRIIVEIAKKRLPFSIKGKCNIVNVSDVAKGTVNALEMGKKGRLYVLGGINTTIEEFCLKTAEICNVPIPTKSFNPVPLLSFAWLTEIIGKMTFMNKPLFPLVGLHFAIYGEHLSSDIAEKEIAYQPTSDYEGLIRESYEWFKANNYLD